MEGRGGRAAALTLTLTLALTRRAQTQKACRPGSEEVVPRTKAMMSVSEVTCLGVGVGVGVRVGVSVRGKGRGRG